MFTGLVQGMGSIMQIKEYDSSIELTLSIGELASEVSIGESISVNGTCLTVTTIHGDNVCLDVMKQTLALTNLKELHVRDKVNLELAVLPTQRLGGHIVQGHVDGVGAIATREPGERWERFLVSLPTSLMRYVVPQGSLTINGVSLTVGIVDDALSQVELWIIPETLSKTIFSLAKVGDLVNIEVDLLGKYVERLLAKGITS